MIGPDTDCTCEPYGDRISVTCPVHFLSLTRPPVTIGSIWEHHSGRIYTVYDITNEGDKTKPNYPTMISYVDQLGRKWSGKLSDWHRRMKPLVFEPNEK